MIANTYSYCILQFRPCDLRDEATNVGLVVFKEDGVDVRIVRSHSKLRALVTGIDDDLLPGAVRDIHTWASKATTLSARYAAIRRLGYFRCSPLGTFSANSEIEYSKVVRGLFEEWVKPLPTLPEPTDRVELVFNKLRRRLDEMRVLTSKPEDVDYGMVMPRFPIDPQSRIFVDYAYRSSEGLNLIETVNLAAPVDRLKKILIYKAFVLNHARKSGQKVFASLVYEGGIPGAISGIALQAVQACTDELVNLDDAKESFQFLTRIKQQATPNYSLPLH